MYSGIGHYTPNPNSILILESFSTCEKYSKHYSHCVPCQLQLQVEELEMIPEALRRIVNIEEVEDYAGLLAED